METTNKLTFMNKVALQGLSIYGMLILALSGGLAYMIADLGITTSQAVLVLMIPSFVGIPFCLFSGVFCSKFGSRTISIVGAIIFSVTGIIPFFTKVYSVILISRALHGIGYGIVQGVSTVLLKDYYPEEELAKANGVKQAAQNASAIIYGIVGGALSNISWNYAYAMYFIAIPVAVIMIFWLPKTPVVTAQPAANAPKQKIVLTGASWGWMIGMFVFMLSIGVFSNQISNYVIGHGIGDATQAGLVTSISTAAGFFAALVFAKVMGKLGKWTMPLSLLIVAVTMWMIPATQIYAIVVLAGAIQGLGYSTAVPCAVVGASTSTDPVSASTAISGMVAAMLLGNVASEYVVLPLSNLLGWGDTADGRYYVAAIIAVICMFYFYIIQSAQAKKAAQ